MDNPRGKCRPSAGIRKPGGAIRGRLGAIPKVYESSNQNRRGGSPYATLHTPRGTNGQNGGFDRSKQMQNSFPERRQFINHRVLNFEILTKLANDKVEPSEVIRCLGDSENDLASFLMENWRNPEYLELIIVALGGFCKKSGTSQFTESFVTVVKILANQKVFAQIPLVIINIPTSQAKNLPTRETRLRRLTTAIFHLATEILVMMPAYGCEFLGQNFFTDLLSLETMPSIKSLNVSDAFLELKDGIPLLETAWSQNIPERKEERRDHGKEYMEELSLQDPPDNFRTLNITPGWDDICLDVEPFLRPNIVKGAYPDVATYLDIQFRLLREDFFYPLRMGLLAYKSQADHRKYVRRSDNIRLYHHVRILDYDMNREMHTIQFAAEHLKRINWETSKRFMFASLLLLSFDNFNSFLLCTVAERNPRELVEGKIKVKFEGGMLPVHVKRETFVMAESTVFFESYRGVLAVLQRISPTNFPLKDYILGQKCAPEKPNYLAEEEAPLYDLSILRSDFNSLIKLVRCRALDTQLQVMKGDAEGLLRRLEQVAIFDPKCRLTAADLKLDPSQTAALYAALTQKLSVIQGPPGTGKTYLGLRIVQALLQNKKFWFKNDLSNRKSPILVICYTNHALDQFLEGISKFTGGIVRIGSQSKCAELETYSLSAWKKRRGSIAQRDTKKWIFEINEKLRELDKEREIIHSILILMESRGLIHEDSLLEMNIIPQLFNQKFRDLKKWMVNCPSEWTPLQFWLQTHNNEELDRVASFFSRKGFAKKHVNPVPQHKTELPEMETETADDQWDKEHIDEIEAQRKMDEDDDYFEILKETKYSSSNEKTDELINNRVYVKFALKLSSLDNKIKELKESLQNFEKEDAKWVKMEIEDRQINLNLLRPLLQIVPVADEKQLENLYRQNLFQIPVHQRWMMYSSWRRKALDIQEQRAADIEKLYHENAAKLKDVRSLESAEICQNADVVGFTTTGAARNRALLNHLKPKIVIVEEAAEVLEAHVVCALSTSCEQLILIGDHKQLRPPVTVFKLAKDFSLDVSLFERLIKNGMEPCILGVQHRMRPEIARLIVPSIYPSLENHASVLEYPSIRGISSNVFFLSHTEQEVADHEGKSHLNPYEAELSLALARHFIMQGYDPSQITILTTYSGQLLHFFKLRRNHSAAQSVRISVVDNFQGEENDIIILSLVRSNDDENIGFLRIENRICVALSRAKHGFFIIGNMQNLQGRSKLWNEISQILSANGQLGPDFPLKCEVHDVLTKACNVIDFPPEGGCLQKCVTKRDCGHTCPKMCHGYDRTHVRIPCKESCTRLCPHGHPCPSICFEKCPSCMVPVTKTLPCLHEQIVSCHKDPAKEFCETVVWKILPPCGHGKELQCGAKPSDAVCPEQCGMQRNCGHICQLPCHKKSSHDKIPCEQPCRRTCTGIDKHKCEKKCREECGQCVKITKKLLPCGHEADVECYKLPQDVYCKVKIEKILSKCQHSYETECGFPIDGIKCTRPCEKILCGDGHPCKKRCFQPCGRCFVRMKRELKCGHTATRECSVDPSKIKCPEPKESVLPACGHRAVIKCGDDPDEAHCSLPCEVRLDCGHTCTMNCHVKHDPDHEEYKCKKPCGKMKQGCKMTHKCGKKCYEDCDRCDAKWKRTLPCGHTVFTECHRDDSDIFCPIMVTKTIPECGHQVKVDCSIKPTRSLNCQKACASVLSCGHLCKKKCCEPCSSADCVQLVTTSQNNFCGHKVTVPCKTYAKSGGMLTEWDLQQHLKMCKEPCGALLDCTHLCKGTCGECFNGRVHLACKEHCGRSLVCGHTCNVNCGLTCPPCKKKCEYSCSHSKCSLKCCEPCIPCQEPCQWKCEHKACTKKCGQRCDRTKCDEPCKKTLPCGHSCAGLCGEICPPLCRICDKETLMEFILLGNEEDEDAKFIFLPECKHCIEVDGMDHWMATDGDGQIQPKRCPRCKTTIRICMRYGDIIKSTFEDIAQAKKKILNMRGNNPLEFFNKTNAKHLACKRLLEKLRPNRSSVVKAIEWYSCAVGELLMQKKKNGRMTNPSLGSDQRFQIQVNLEIMERVLEMLRKVLALEDPTKPEFVNEFCSLTLKLLDLAIDRDRISVEEYRAAARELDRLDYLRAYFVLQSANSYASVGKITPERELIESLLMKNVRVLEKAQEQQIKVALETLGKKLRTGLGISDRERQEIVKAMGMTKGHWYKCPNGHIYAIGDCGGATMESRCNECHAPIGGGQHRLRGDNTLAGEMDGAVRSAWPGNLY